MGIFDTVMKVAGNFKKVFMAAEKHFSPELIKLGIEKEQIEKKSLEGLEESLDVVEKALEKPESFGTVKFKISSDGEPEISSEGNYEYGIEPFLLIRKRLIVERIKFLKGDESIETLRKSAEQIPDEDIRKEVIEKVNNIKEETRHWEEKYREADEASEKEQDRSAEELAKLEKEVALLERRSKVWLSFLERESVATIIGGALMLIMSIALLLAMFYDIKTTEIIKSAYLVILGYFFGQAASKKNE